jgi:hypothetical protein
MITATKAGSIAGVLVREEGALNMGSYDRETGWLSRRRRESLWQVIVFMEVVLPG